MAEIDLHKTSSIDQCQLIELGKHHHPNGNLTVVENGVLVPFDLKRVFYIYQRRYWPKRDKKSKCPEGKQRKDII